MAIVSTGLPAYAAETEFGPSNPFYAESTLPFHAPPFDKIKDTDYQPAIEAGMANSAGNQRDRQQSARRRLSRTRLSRWKRRGRLLDRAHADILRRHRAPTPNPVLQKVQNVEAPKLAAHSDAIYLNAKLFQRVTAIYKQRESLKLDPESLRLVEYYYKQFVHAGANLSRSRQGRS